MAATKKYLTTSGFTLNEIGQELGVSRERVRQLMHSGIEKIRLNLAAANIGFDDLDPSDIKMIISSPRVGSSDDP